MAQCQIRGGVHQRLPKRCRRSEQLASVLHVLQSRADSSSVGLSNASAGVYEQIRRVFSNSCVLSYFRPKTVLTFGTTIIGFGSSEFVVLRSSERILPELVYRFV